MDEKQGLLTEQQIAEMTPEQQREALASSLNALIGIDREAGLKILKQLNPALVPVETTKLFTRGRKLNRAERRAQKHRK